MSEQPTTPKKEFSKKFLGGSVTLKPEVHFQGKTGPVDLPDRIVVKIEGDSINLSAAALDALVWVAKNPACMEFLDGMRLVEQEAQNE